VGAGAIARMAANPNITGRACAFALLQMVVNWYYIGVDWKVYIISCSDNSLYTGITLDVERRFSEHAGVRRAKYFRGRKPGEVVYMESGHTRSTASKREAVIKKLLRVDKLELIASEKNELM
jgi:putative endonuclease